MSSPAIRACPPAVSARRRCATPSSISACRRCARAIVRPGAARRDGALLSAPRSVCEQCFLVQLEEYVSAGGDLHRLRLLLVVLRLLGRARPQLSSESAIERFGLGPDSQFVVELASNDGYLLQHFVERGHPGAGGRARGERRRGRRSTRGIADRGRFFGRDLASTLVDQGRAGRSARREQRAGPRPGSERLRRRAWNEFLARQDGVVTIEFPHLVAPDRGESVRHDLPRALLLLLVPDHVERVFAAHGLDVFDVEELRHAWRLAARLRASGRAGRPARQRGRGASSRTRELSAGLDRPRSATRTSATRDRRTKRDAPRSS